MQKEMKKLIWMREEFLRECQRMLKLIEKQELKIIEERKKKKQ